MILTLEETKKYLRVDFDDDDELIESFIMTGEKLMADVLRVELETFEQMPASRSGIAKKHPSLRTPASAFSSTGRFMTFSP